MKTRVVIWLASLGLFLASLAVLGPMLPERVATHFGAAGQANGWMSRSQHLVFFLIFGLLYPSFMIGLCYAVRFFPAKFLNVPHPEYWRAPEHYREACAYLFRESFWLGTLSSLWVTGIHALIIVANRHGAAHLDGKWSLALTAAFLAGVAVWMFRLWRHFKRLSK